MAMGLEKGLENPEDKQYGRKPFVFGIVIGS